MTDVVASVSIEVKTGGFEQALRHVKSFVERTEAAGQNARNLNTALRELSQTMQAMSSQSSKLKSSGDDLNKVVSSGTTRWNSHARSVDRAAEALKKLAAAQKSAGATAPGAGGPSSSGGGGGVLGHAGAHGFLSMSSSGLHAGVLGQIHPAVAAVTMAAELGISAVQTFFGAITDGIGAALQASMKMDQVRAAMHVVAGSEAGVAKEMKFVEDTANRLALPLTETALAYAKLGAAAGDNAKAQEAAKTSFIGVATAARAMHLSAGDTSGAIKALVDMFSKGQVMSEELKKQLGNRLPGAMRIAGDVARGMGLNLQDALTKGVLKGEKALEFISRFGEALTKEFGDAAAVASGNLASSMARAENAATLLGDRFANMGVKQGAATVLSTISDELTRIKERLEEIGGTDAGAFLATSFQTLGEAIAGVIRDLGLWSETFLGDEKNVYGLASAIFGLASMIRGVAEAIHAVYLGLKLTNPMLFAWRAMSHSGWGKNIAEVKELAGTLKKMGENQSDLELRFGLAMMNRGYEEKQRELDAQGKPRPGSPLPPNPPDKAAIRLAEQQDRFIAGLSAEVDLHEIMKGKLESTISLYKEMIKLKLGSVEDDKFVPKGAKGVFAATQIDLRDEQKQIKGQDKKIAEEEAKLNDSQQKLLDKVQARYTLESAFPGIHRETIATYQALIALGVAQLDTTTGELRTYTDLADKIKAAADQEQRRLEIKAKDHELVKDDEYIANRYGKTAGGEMDNERKRLVNFVANRSGGTGVLGLSESDKATYLNALHEIRIKTEETYAAMAHAVEASANIMENSLVDFATKQIRSWSDVRDGLKNMISQILAEFARMMIRMMIMAPIMKALREMMTGVGSGTSSIAGATGFDAMYSAMGFLANGGPAQAGRPYTVGERGPETFIPAVSGVVLPSGASGGAGNVQVVVNVDNRGNETSGSSAQQSGGDLSQGIRRVVVDEIRNQSRTGGHLWKMQQRMV